MDDPFMTQNFTPEQIKDLQLQSLLLYVGEEEEGDPYIIYIRDLYDKSPSLRDPSKHPFNFFLNIRQTGREKKYFVPSYESGTHTPVVIHGFEEVLGKECALVHATSNDRDFVFFDPLKNSSHTYGKLLGQELDLKLSIIGTGGGMFPVEPSDRVNDLFLVNQQYLIRKQGYAPIKRFPQYNGLFETEQILEEKDDSVRVSVRSPFYDNQKLEMVTNNLETKVPERFCQEFYFMGLP